MIAGELKSKIDRLWDTFWSGGISNPLEVIEQITYLMFVRRLDSVQTGKERRANRTGTGREPALHRGQRGQRENGRARPDRGLDKA
jgi:type I restriction enzyme M protein